MTRLSDLPELLASSNWQAAETLLRREANRKNCPAHVFYNLAKVLEVSGKAQQMGGWLEKAVGADPSYAIAWHELGRWHLAYDRLVDAHVAMEKAHSLDPADEESRLALARLALRLGHWQQAELLWSQMVGPEADMARYRITVETGSDGSDMAKALLADKTKRPEVLRTLTRTSKGRISLKID